MEVVKNELFELESSALEGSWSLKIHVFFKNLHYFIIFGNNCDEKYLNLIFSFFVSIHYLSLSMPFLISFS